MFEEGGGVDGEAYGGEGGGVDRWSGWKGVPPVSMAWGTAVSNIVIVSLMTVLAARKSMGPSAGHRRYWLMPDVATRTQADVHCNWYWWRFCRRASP